MNGTVGPFVEQFDGGFYLARGNRQFPGNFGNVWVTHATEKGKSMENG
jgi:hypothetical protein